MAAGYPVKVNYLTGDVLTAANLNDLAGTVNLYDPTAKGDLFPATAADTVSRLEVGANATVLTADSTAATGMKWAAGATSGFVGCTAAKAASQTIADSTYTAISFDAADIVDTNAFHDTTTNNSRMTIPAGLGGKYLILLSFTLSASTTSGFGQALIYKNGTAIVIQNNGFPGTAGGEVMERIMYVDIFAAGDYIEGYCIQGTGNNRLIQSNTSGTTNQALFSIVFLGA